MDTFPGHRPPPIGGMAAACAPGEGVLDQEAVSNDERQRGGNGRFLGMIVANSAVSASETNLERHGVERAAGDVFPTPKRCDFTSRKPCSICMRREYSPTICAAVNAECRIDVANSRGSPSRSAFLRLSFRCTRRPIAGHVQSTLRTCGAGSGGIAYSMRPGNHCSPSSATSIGFYQYAMAQTTDEVPTRSAQR